MRSVFHLILLFPASIFLAWLFARAIGRWWMGVLGGILGVSAVGALMGALHFTGWLNLGETPLEAAFKYTEVFGWNVGILGGITGTAMGLLARRRKPHKPEAH